MSIMNVHIDSTGRLADDGADPTRVEQACGVLLDWARMTPDERSFQEHMDLCYQYGLHEMEGIKISHPFGMWQSPHSEDPDLAPYAMITRTDRKEIMYIYRSSFVAFVSYEGSDDPKYVGTSFCCRMD